MWNKYQECPACGKKRFAVTFVQGDGLFSDMRIAYCGYCGFNCTAETLEYIMGQSLHITPKEIAERILEG